MKIKVKTSIEPFYKIPILGKVLNRFLHKFPVIEGYEALFHVEYSDLDSKDAIPILSFKPVIVEPHGIEGGFDRWGYEPWFSGNNLTMKFYPSVSGYIELRVYFKDLKDSDTIIDDYGRAQTFKRDIGPDKVRYYYKPFRVYSLYEVLIVLFTGIVTIFTILLFVITILFFLIQW
ncbi:hypothetical protein ES703_42923 [subsurface metagenome]